MRRQVVIDLSRSPGNAAQALRADDSVRTTADGASWRKCAQPSALALESRAAGGDGTTYLAVRQQVCVRRV